MLPTYGHVTKINKRKNTNCQQNLEVFLAGTDSEKKII